MRCLGVETSCDETGLALVEDGRLLGQALATQAAVHALFGGVVPEIACREHLRLLPGLFRQLLAETGLTSAHVDAVAVARGPGLLGALLAGVSFAKGLALALDRPLVGVNHLHAHLLAAELESPVALPALGVLVSGGHTELAAMETGEDGHPSFTMLGRTLDDAAGEAFDKAASALRLPYPGGACLDAMARHGDPLAGIFAPPYVDNDNLDFSFSGLKTAASLALRKRPHLRRETQCTVEEAVAAAMAEPELADFCASFNHAVARALAIKAKKALAKEPRLREARSLVLAGGVAANHMVRRELAAVAAERGVAFVAPSPWLCTDNAAMIAHAGWRMARADRRHGLDLEAVPRGRAVPEDWTLATGPACPAGMSQQPGFS